MNETSLVLALEAAEARLRSILQTVPDAMIIIDERGRIESLSTTAERLFGYEADEVSGRNVSILMPSPYREQHDAYIERYLSTNERRIIGIGRIVVGQRKDGSTFPMHLTVGELRAGGRHRARARLGGSPPAAAHAQAVVAVLRLRQRVDGNNHL